MKHLHLIEDYASADIKEVGNVDNLDVKINRNRRIWE